MLLDPILIFLKCFATWLRLRIIMGFAIAWSIIIMSLSAWMSISEGGSFASLQFSSGNSYKNWESAVCQNSPYSYLSPFSFSYSIPGGGRSSANSICPWPSTNTELRLSLSVMSIVLLGILYVKTPISLVARIILGIFAMLYFAVFVMDSTSAITGKSFCSSAFSNTNLNIDIVSQNMSISCDTTAYEVMIVLDLVASVLFFIMHGAWALTKDLYVQKQKKETSESKTLLKKGDKKSNEV